MNYNDYHVIILAAGNSTRLAHMTQDKPKFFLEIRQKRILDYTLDHLAARSLNRVTLVVGYLQDVIFKVYGRRYKTLEINYVHSIDYQSTGHSWSLFLTRPSWIQQPASVLLIHADIFYEPIILDAILESSFSNLIAINENYKKETGDEVLVFTQNNFVKSIKTTTDIEYRLAGEVIGINKWSIDFMSNFYLYMEEFFKRCGRNFNWEPVLNQMLRDKSDTMQALHFLECGRFPWININREQDLKRAQTTIYNLIYDK